MVNIKFTPVKLIINTISPICLILLFATQISLAEQKYAVQIGASKTLLNIKDLVKEYNITDSYSSNVSSNFEIKSTETDSIQQSSVFGEKNGNGLFIETKNQPQPTIRGKGNILTLFLGKNKVSALKDSLIDYCNNNLPQEIRGFYIALIDKTFQFPIILLFIAFILFFVLNIVIVFLILNYTVKMKKQNERYRLIYGKIYEEVLILYMFGEIDWEKASIKLKKKHRKENRKILISILLNFHENFKGEMEMLIHDIFLKLDLQKDSLKSANSWFNFKKVQGIRELTYLYSAGALDIVSGLINDPNDRVRAEAQIAFIRLNPENPFGFFQALTKPFTRWTQLSAFNLLRVNQLQVPSFTDFLDSKHPNIRNFSLWMIVYFQQLENIPKIIKMLESEMDLARFLSYRAINDLRLYEGRELIKTRFSNETDKNKLEIVKAFRNIGSEEDFDFLENIIKSESVSLKIEACRSMYYMNMEGKDRLLEMKNDRVPELELYIAHVTDLRN